MGAKKGVFYALKKYSLIVIFPAVSGFAIYTDWKHTKAWREEQLANLEQSQ